MRVANDANATEDVRTALFSTAGPDVIAEERQPEVAKVEGTAPSCRNAPFFCLGMDGDLESPFFVKLTGYYMFCADLWPLCAFPIAAYWVYIDECML